MASSLQTDTGECVCGCGREPGSLTGGADLRSFFLQQTQELAHSLTSVHLEHKQARVEEREQPDSSSSQETDCSGFVQTEAAVHPTGLKMLIPTS